MKKLIYLLALSILAITQFTSCTKTEIQNGDIIFQISKSRQSIAIQKATQSKYSHMGIIYIIKDKKYVFEAVSTVKITPFEDWVNHGENHHYVIKRLKNSEKILTPKNLMKMKKIGEKYKGKRYDIYFEWSDETIYCSELVWKIYKEALGIEIGELRKLESFDLSAPIVKKIMNERYKGKIPLNEEVISPADMFNSDILKTIIVN